MAAYCAICWDTLGDEGPLADKFIYKLGELAYIELAHLECAKKADDCDLWRTD